MSYHRSMRGVHSLSRSRPLLPPQSAPIWRDEHLTYDFGGRIVRSDFLSFMAGRTLAFHWCHGGIIDRNGWVKVFKKEDAMKKKRNEKAFVSMM